MLCYVILLLEAPREAAREDPRRLNGYSAQRVPGFFLQAVLGDVRILQFLEVCFPGALGAH